ncbi:hypothetical protein [Rubellimicrobium aerolatum]|uniref:Uncharacterized protein n=1 Tax=Rubellimicrobium aerolatum TaxID=490979 RepID=A0ABW0SDU3_9RHOB|nr:hypothetical protein [Rubellimicrobium aerolatum]MBP1807674.1 hypothetical protein [Rubellimicrobium aerolatum]
MAIRRIQPILSRDTEYTKPFPGGGALGTPPAPEEAQAPTREPLAPAAEPTPAAVAPLPVEPQSIEPQPVERRPVEPTPVAARAAKARAPQPLAPTPSPALPAAPAPTRKARGQEPKTMFSIWVRPLLAQVPRIDATGLPPQRVLKAAWQRCVARYTLAPGYVEPLAVERSEGRAYGFSTTLRLNAEALTTLLHEHDPLRITPYWSLIRGQVEPLFWQALDEVLAELDDAKTAKSGRGRS